jgi:V/A-type H+-transporting ATPase subunit D
MKIKLSQGELKRQRDALRQYERYLPMLQLKKQQIQREILYQHSALKERKNFLSVQKKSADTWSGLLVEAPEIRQWLRIKKIITARKNVAGVDLPVFERVEFEPVEYDVFITPLWVDSGLEALRDLVSLLEDIRVIEEGILILNHELRITTQRVNLFEKVKIPEAKEAIRLIKIYLGDQMTNAVGRSKIAKRKIEEADSKGAAI